MNKSTKQVAEFHRLFKHPIRTQVSAVEEETAFERQFRLSFLLEELGELAEAENLELYFASTMLRWIKAKVREQDVETLNIIQGLLDDFEAGEKMIAAYVEQKPVDRLSQLDALVDLQYVLDGKILQSGFGQVFDKAFKAVHDNNMSKATPSMVVAKKTAEAIQATGTDQDVTIEEERIDGKLHYIVKEGKKVKKPLDYKPVDLTKFIE